MPRDFQVLAYEETPLGILCLRRRKTLSEPREWVTEITLNHEFLMSSLHTESERQLVSIPLQKVDGENLRVLIGGLGLGYTASQAVADPRVQSVTVVEYLPSVIAWMRAGLTPLADSLNQSEKLVVIHDDVFRYLLEPSQGADFDAILIDVDHSPEAGLEPGTRPFYSREGLARASKQLSSGGVLAVWSYAQHTLLLDAMGSVFASAEEYPITYHNRHVDEAFTDWLYVGCRRHTVPGGGGLSEAR